MEDKQAIALLQAAAKLASTIPEGSPVKILKYQSRRLWNLPDQAAQMSESDLVMLVATIFPLIHCLRKIFSYKQLIGLLTKMEEGEENEKRDDNGTSLSADITKPN